MKDGWRAPFLALLEPLLQANPPIPWTFCPGNHDDDESPWCRLDLLKVFSLPGCITPDATSFNHTFTVGFAEYPDPACSVRLWIFDSGGNDPDTRFGTVDASVVAGYQELVQSLSQDSPPSPAVPCAPPTRPLANLAYFHIPLPEYNNCTPIVGRYGLFDALVKAKMLPRPWKWIPWFPRLVDRHRVVCVCVCVCVHACMDERAYVWVVYACVYVCMYVCTYVCTYRWAALLATQASSTPLSSRAR